MGFPNGLSLDGLEVQRTVAFRLPGSAELDSAHLDLHLRFARAAIPESNLQIFIAGTRIGVAMRQAADSSGALRFQATIPSSMLRGDYLPIVFRSASSTMRDRCLDERLALGYVQLDSSSSLTYFAPESAIATIRQVWASFPDTITLTLPARRMTADEFRAAYTLGIAASNEGRTLRYAQLPNVGELLLASPADYPTIDGFTAPSGKGNVGVFHFMTNGESRPGLVFDAHDGAASVSLVQSPWLPLAAASDLTVRTAAPTIRPNVDDPTFADLNLGDLQREVASEGVWTLPIDLRELPAGRVPVRIDLQVVTAPNTHDRNMVFFAFLNGTLVRTADINERGGQQLIDIRLPASLIATRNELRVVIQRHRPPSDICTEADRALPAQLLPSSRVVTTKADGKSRAFTSVTAQVAAFDPIYLPSAALDRATEYLPMLVSLGRAFWSAQRAPMPTFYGSTEPAKPSGAFFVVGRPSGVVFDAPSFSDSGHFTVHRKDVAAPLIDVAELRDWSMAQVVGWNGHLGVQLLPASGRRRIPDSPEAYGASSLVLADADSTVFQLNTAGKDDALIFNDGPMLYERIRSDWVLWSLFLLIVIVPPAIWAVRAVVRRTPRRELRRATPPEDRAP